MKRPDIRARFIRPSLDPQKLVHFLSVYETGLFSAAAEESGVTQQAVSKSIARLEESLGVSLFERSSFGAKPTIFADALVKRARAIISESSLAAAELTALRGAGTGYVRIGLGWAFMPRIAPAMIERFKRAHSDVTLSIKSGDSKALYRALLQGDVEMVISGPPDDLPVDAGIERKPLFLDIDHMVMRAGHPLAAKAGDVSFEDYGQQTWMLSMQLNQQWQRVSDLFLERKLEPPRSVIDLDSVILLKSMLLSSDGVSLVPTELVAQPHEKALFHTIEDTPFPIKRTAYLATRKDAELQVYARQLCSIFDGVWRELIDPKLHLA